VNKKLTVLSPRENILCCVLSNEESYEKQLERLLDIHGHGICAVFDGKTLKVRDYYVDETMATFEVISFTDTDEDVCLEWRRVSGDE
jgi:hypothetical protein